MQCDNNTGCDPVSVHDDARQAEFYDQVEHDPSGGFSWSFSRPQQYWWWWRVTSCATPTSCNCLCPSGTPQLSLIVVSDDSQPQQRMTRVPMPRDLSQVLVLVITLWPAGKSFAYNNFWHLQLPRLEGGQCNNNNNCNHNAPSQFSHTTPRLFAGQLQSHYCC